MWGGGKRDAPTGMNGEREHRSVVDGDVDDRRSEEGDVAPLILSPIVGVPSRRDEENAHAMDERGFPESQC